MASTPWAILLCKFNDNTAPDPHPRKFYEDLFTSKDPASMSMVNFFRDMSHGTLDLSGTKIFPSKEIGWFTVNASYKKYLQLAYSPVCGGVNDPDPKKRPSWWVSPRGELVRWAKEAATTYHPDWPTVDLSKFYGVVIVFNIGVVDTFGGAGPPRTVCDEQTVKPSILGQEMGHGYGLHHSKRDGSEAEYQDPWDIMSTLNGTFTAGHPTYDLIGPPPGLTVCDNDSTAATYGTLVTVVQHRGLSIGPGLNAATMDNQRTYGEGWLDSRRIRKIDRGKSVIELRPLHRLDLDGDLVVLVDGYYVEFRMNEIWDAGLPGPVVLIHYYSDNHSYIVADNTGNYGFTKGSIFEIKDEPHLGFNYHLKVEVLDIDSVKKQATISIDYSGLPTIDISDTRFIIPWEYVSPAIPYTRPVRDIAIVNEKIRSTPQWSLLPIVKSLADISSSERFKNQDIRRSIREESLETIIRIASEELNHTKFPGGIVTSPLDSHDDHDETQ